MVWFHGGAFRQGSESYEAEGVDGAAAASQGQIVFVSLTHRLGALGYLQLSDEFGPSYASSGNAGMLDLAAALKWVKATRYSLWAPSTFPRLRSKVPSGRWPAFRAPSRRRQSVNPSAGRDDKRSSAAATTSRS